MRAAMLLAVASLAAGCASMRPSPIAEARQLVVVTSESWDATHATLRRYERVSASDPWREVGAAVPSMLGRTGLAWGLGVNHETGEGPVKRAGDGKSPAGVFRLGRAFGFAEAPGALHLPYVALKPTTECVDDTKSQHYNRIVDRADVAQADWNSSEKMRAIADYQWGLVVLHNDAPQPGAGSCIFLHISSGKPTAGCTAMAPEAIESLVRWLDPARHPLLVQLTESEYARLRSAWRLP